MSGSYTTSGARGSASTLSGAGVGRAARIVMRWPSDRPGRAHTTLMYGVSIGVWNRWVARHQRFSPSKAAIPIGWARSGRPTLAKACK